MYAHTVSLYQTSPVLVHYTDSTQDELAGDSGLFGGSGLGFGGLGGRPSSNAAANPFGGGGIASATPLAAPRGPFSSSGGRGGFFKPSALGKTSKC